jgi:hypothetical protein
VLGSRLRQLPGEISVPTPEPPVTPTIYIIGLPDRSVESARKTHGLTLNGVWVTEDLLSESVLILRPNGTGNWADHAGFDIFRESQFQDD